MDLDNDTFLKWSDSDATAAASAYAEQIRAQCLAFDTQRQIDDATAAGAKDDDAPIRTLKDSLKDHEDTVRAQQQTLGDLIGGLVKVHGYDKHATGGWRHEVAMGGVTLLKVKKSAG